MKKEVLGILFIFLIFLNLAFLQAQTASANETKKVNAAYSCLENKVEGKCSSLSTEEKIFSLLATGECKTELTSASQNSGQCWSDISSGSCKIKTTAQAILALDNVNGQTSTAQNWLLSQNKSPTELMWYLQIENPNGETSCAISYGDFQYNIIIGEDKKINDDAGPCLTLAQDNYWLQISPSKNCFEQNFTTSCNNDFSTTLLFTKSTSSTIHVLPDTHSAKATGETTEKVKSSCFAENNFCNYEGTLWAALVLDALDKDVSAYLPYLITSAEDNPKYLPDAFLYFITKDETFQTSLLSKQKNNKWWSESGDRYYDTALALYPLLSETLPAKTSAKEWLLESQDANGCWQDNIVNTAFILASVWPREFGGGGGGGLPSCTSKGYCVTKGSCEGSVYADYDCSSSLFACCSVQPSVKTCSELNGKTCASGQTCDGSWDKSASDTLNCCKGICITPEPTKSECETASGICKSSQCSSKEDTLNYDCDDTDEYCCVEKISPSVDYTWIIILIILIVLILLAIIFRDKLRNAWLKMKSGKGKGPGPRPGLGYKGSPSHPPFYPRPPARPFAERRILVPQRPRQPIRPIKSGASKELDDVLKKLKDMGK